MCVAKEKKSRPLQLENGVWGRYSPFLQALLEQFISDSFADSLFCECVLLGLRMEYEAEYRAVIWSEISPSLQSVTCHPPLDMRGYLWPYESEEKVLRQMEAALVETGLEFQQTPALFAIATHHLMAFLSYSQKETLMRRGKILQNIILHTDKDVYTAFCNYHLDHSASTWTDIEWKTDTFEPCHALLPVLQHVLQDQDVADKLRQDHPTFQF
eukprot:TRINITY_DN14540_c0_g1_i1.p1 TRINITY_DN14540_c0_g1~~TRINITY_DN14540_c0_g1_i1.p1  ORF type:complete len:230 (+),score=38.87 TRINITY_DN14540_c0_g1_i1:54-692(+)